MSGRGGLETHVCSHTGGGASSEHLSPCRPVELRDWEFYHCRAVFSHQVNAVGREHAGTGLGVGRWGETDSMRVISVIQIREWVQGSIWDPQQPWGCWLWVRNETAVSVGTKIQAAGAQVSSQRA